MNRSVLPPHFSVIVLAAALRFYRLAAQSLWADEGNSAALATRSLLRIAQDAAADIHPPLYYWLLRLWTALFGLSEGALRSLSAICGVALVYVIYLIGRRLHSERLGIVAAFLAAVNPFQIYYAQEARMYMLLGLWSGLLLYAFTRYVLNEGAGHLRPARGPAALLVVALIGGAYTHYTFVAVVAAVNILYLLWLWDSRRRGQVGMRLGWWIGWHLLAALAFLPWLPIAQRQLTIWPRPAAAGFGEALGAALATLSLGPVGYRQPTWGWNLLYIVGLLLGLWTQRRAASGRREHWLGWSIPFLTMAAPIALLIQRGLATEAYLKFLIAGSPGFCLLLARGILNVGEALGQSRTAPSPRARGRAPARGTQTPAWLQPGWYALAATLVGISAATTLQAYYFDPRYARDDYRALARYIEAAEQPGDHIVLAAPGQQEVFAYYYRGSLPIHPLPRQRPVDAADLRAQIAQITAAPGRIYAILWALEQADPEGILESELARRAYKASEVWQGNLRFAIYTVPDEALPPTSHETLTAWTFGAPPVVTLSRVDLGAATVTAGDILPLRLTWQAEQTLIDPYKVTLQLLDARDQVIAQRDIELGGSRQPNDPWTAGQEAADSLGVLVRPGTPPGRYRLIVAVYRPQDGSRLPTTVDGRAQDHIELGEITVTRPAEPPAPITLGMQHPLAADFGPLELLGFDAYPRGFSHAPETPLAPGGVLQVALYWRARSVPTSRLLARLELGEGIVVAEGDAASADYPTTAWAAGEVVRGDHALWLPADLPPGRYPLSVSLLEGGARLGKPLRLTTIVVERAGQ